MAHSVTVNDEGPHELIKLVEEKPAGLQAMYVKVPLMNSRGGC